MITIPGYQLTGIRHESARSLIYQATRSADGLPVLLKTLRPDYPSPMAIARFQMEYEMLQHLNLAGLEGVIQAYGLETYQQRPLIVLEDFGGQSLQEWIAQHRFGLKECLSLAIQITTILGQIHQQNVIHKDINPFNIVLQPSTGQIKLIDFGIASVLSREMPTFCHPTVLEGTLAYLSPEQTGRMNRSVDYRTDFYSLGVTLYQLLCDRLPFTSQDPLELLHCHLAKQPLSLQTIVPTLPQPLSDIVMKLLAKNAEDRYQSPQGLRADLQTCLDALQQDQAIAPFQIGRWDRSSQFQIPQKLYGREQEVAQLLATFECVAAESPELPARSELMLVSGQPGIGKTTLVQELYKPITQRRGYLITGKYEQLQRTVPYSALIQAFQALIRQLLTESEVQVQQWRQKLLAALGDNAQVVIDVIPDVELLLGQQPAVIPLSSAESHNRFHLVLEAFVQVFAQSGADSLQPVRPLVIFLDDLQWIDRASLQLIQRWMTVLKDQRLLVIGAYRDTEVDASHPLRRSLQEMTQAGGVVRTLHLSPLGLADVNRLLQDTLHCSSEQALSLAQLTEQKTAGNPFFINEFLHFLHQEQLIHFDPEQGVWNWDLSKIQTTRLAENVVDLVTARIQDLPRVTQAILSLAACIGSQFNLQMLVSLSQSRSPQVSDITTHRVLTYRAILQALRQACQANLITRLSDRYTYSNLPGLEQAQQTSELDSTYQFLHDRIQQAAYALLSPDQRAHHHLSIGQYLLHITPLDQQEDLIFDIVDHLNLGAELLTESAAKRELAALNLRAGRKAKMAIAYEPAVRYLASGRQLLAASSWQSDYELTLALYTEATEAEFLNLNFAAATQLADQVIQQAHSLLDRIPVYEIQMQFYSQQNQLQDTLDLGLQLLAMLDVPLAQSLITPVEPAALAQLPPMTDPTKLAAMRVLISLAPSAYVVAPSLFAQIPTTLINLCVQYGNSPLAAVAYGFRGLALCASPDGVELGYQFAQLALDQLQRFNAKEIKAQVYVIFNGHIRHWKEPLKQSIPALLEGLQIGLETGALEYAGYNALYACDHRFFAGESLTVVAQHQAQHLETMLKLRQEVHRPYLKIWRVLLLKLMDMPPEAYSVGDEPLDETELLKWSIAADKHMFVFAAYLTRVIWCCLLQDYAQAIAQARLAEKYQDGIVGLLIDAEHQFYYALALLGQASHSPDAERSQQLALAAQLQDKLRQWATHAPMNFLHKFYLVAAERHRLLAQLAAARDAYDQAIALANQHDYLQEAALAHELAGQFYLAQGDAELAHTHLRDARHFYERWGAIAKVRDLEQRYPQVFQADPEPTLSSLPRPASLPTTSGSTATVALDLAALMKASQALSDEIVLDKLLAKLMRILLENAGAQQGCLLLERDGHLQLEATANEATANIEIDSFSRLPAIPLDTADAGQYLPLAIAHYVARTQESLVLNQASQDNRFNQDDYILRHQPQSVLCTPLLHQGKRVGILYLENQLTTNAFTSDRLEILQFLSTQAAISLDNAQLYNQLEQRVEQRTAELTQTNQRLQAEILERQRSEQTLRMIVEGTAAVTGVDFFRGLVRSLAQVLGVRYAFVSECMDAVPNRVRSFAFWQGDGFGDAFEYDLGGTPCEAVIRSGGYQCFPAQIQALFPQEREELEAMQAQSYAGITLRNASGALLGHLAVLDVEPMENQPRTQALLEIFAARAAAEMERQQAEDALRISEAKFSTAFRSSPDAITINTLNQGCYIEVNDSCLRMLGYERQEMIGRTALELNIWANPADRELIKQQLQHQGSVTNLEIRLRRKSGELFPALFSAERIDLENGPCLLAVATDITMLKQAEKALMRLAEIGELAAMIVHEVRNPLTTITIGLNAFKRLELSERFQEYLTLSLEEADRLQRLLNQILLYSKQQVLQRSPLELNQFLTETLQTLRTAPVALDKQLLWQPSPESIHLLVDPDKLKQVIINLITNACEAVQPGDVITTQVQISADHCACIQIHNGGAPIPAEVLPKLTQPFFTTKPSGTGLGLAIVRRMVEAHEGEFAIVSTAAGTTVTVKLPLAALISAAMV